MFAATNLAPEVAAVRKLPSKGKRTGWGGFPGILRPSRGCKAPIHTAETWAKVRTYVEASDANYSHRSPLCVKVNPYVQGKTVEEIYAKIATQRLVPNAA